MFDDLIALVKAADVRIQSGCPCVNGVWLDGDAAVRLANRLGDAVGLGLLSMECLHYDFQTSLYQFHVMDVKPCNPLA